MKDILYVAFFNEQNHFDCLSLSAQIEPFDSQDLLCVFNNSSFLEAYASKISQNRNYGSFLPTKDTNLPTVVQKYQYEYKYIVFMLNNKIIINDNLIKDIGGNSCFSWNIGESIVLLGTDQHKLMDLRTVTVELLLSNNFTKSSLNIQEIRSYGVALAPVYIPPVQLKIKPEKKEKEERKIKRESVWYYDSNDLILAKFYAVHDDIPESFVFIDKIKKQAFHTKDGLSGTVSYFDGTCIEIDWVVNGSVVSCFYCQVKNTHIFA